MTVYTDNLLLTPNLLLAASDIETANSLVPSATPTQATPTFSPVGGTYTGAQTVTISSASADHIYYTTDGSTPTPSSTEYTSPVTVSSSETVKAIATRSGYNNSAVGSAAYTINAPDIAFVNSVTATSNSSPVTSASIDTTASNLLVAVLSGYYGAPTIADSKGNTWNYLTTYGTGADFVRIAYCFNPTTDAAHTFTITQASGYVSAVISTYSGADETSGVFASGSDAGASGSSGIGTVSPGSATPTAKGDLVVTGWSGYGGSGLSVDSGFTEIDSVYTGGQSASLGYLVAPDTSPVAPTWSYVSSYGTGAAIAVFKKA